MKLVAGLGNPGVKYEDTPHNIGFRVMDILAEELGLSRFENNFDSLMWRRSINGEACLFLKPQTYMNRSGIAVAKCIKFYKIPIENILIISDDIDLPPGKARFREGGGHGGHNGLRSIIDSLGNSKFHRMRIGVGRPSEKVSVVGHVLGPWSESDEKFVLKVVKHVVQEIIYFLETSKFKNISFSALKKT